MAEEEHVSASDFAFSLMLTLSITFQMTIFYLVNWPDDDIRAYAWGIIGNTILIFSGVLTFAACDDIVDHFLVEPYPEYHGYILGGQLVFWVSVLQLVIAGCSGLGQKDGEKEPERRLPLDAGADLHHPAPATNDPFMTSSASNAPAHTSRQSATLVTGSSSILGNLGFCCRRKPTSVRTEVLEVPEFPSNPTSNEETRPHFHNEPIEEISDTEEETETEKRRKRNNECFSTLLGHISGFAAIHFFGYVQQNYLNETPLKAFSISIITLFGLMTLFRLWTSARRNLIRPREEVEEMWCEVLIDKENDVAGIACSFLAFLAFRFALIGTLPPIEGKVMATPAFALIEMRDIFWLGIFWLAAGIFMLWVHFASGFIDHEHEEAGPTRISNILQNFCNMCVAWASLLNVKLFFKWLDIFETTEVISARIAIAFLISYAAFIFIWVLDKVDDWMKDRNIEADWMANIITALGLGVGFAWEQSFDTAIDDLGLRMRNRFHIPASLTVWMKLAFSGLLCAIVLPAYRLYILPSVEDADDKKKEKDAKIKARFKGQKRRSIITEASRTFNEELDQVSSLVKQPLLDTVQSGTRAVQSGARVVQSGARRVSSAGSVIIPSLVQPRPGTAGGDE